MERLGEYLDLTFLLTRVFDAPRELVWEAWTEAERLERWWGPKRCRTSVIKLDLRPGGIFHHALHWPQGQDMWGKFVYREIAAPERLVLVNSFADEEGRIAPVPHIKV